MSLRKSPTLTPGLLEACRRNAQKSTGPRTARGKANMRMNALREGNRSRLSRGFAEALLDAPPSGVERVVRDFLTPDLAWHKLFAQLAEIAIEADLPDEERARRWKALWRRKKKKMDCLAFDQQSGNVIENKALREATFPISVDVIENRLLS
jgi:hypothetical protein